ncbi:MAG: radical SAM protein [Elusimicrobia bacterium]|nr:radical SAM protein [Elusimicrobiota bacterium]
MRVALVFNPFSYKVHEENLRVVQKYFGLFPPLSLAWVAAMVRKAGHDVIIVDCRTLDLSKQDAASILKRWRPDVIGAMMTTYMFPETLGWLAYLRSELESCGMRPKVLVGGYNLRVYPRESVGHPEIDFGCLEHAYHTVPALLRELERPYPDLESVPGLVWKRGGRVVINPHPQAVDFDLFPNPARDLLPNELYAEFPTQRKNFTVMVTSLGCPRRCAFCEAGGTPYAPRSPKTVLDEMQECRERHGIREIDIFDYDFTAGRRRVLDICAGIAARKLDVTWACRSRVDNMDAGLLDAMAQAGCRRIYWGIEHSSQETLDSLGKGIRLSAVREMLTRSRRAGIQNLGFFLVGVPGETEASVAATAAFARSLDLDYAQFSKLLAKPGTGLWRDMKRRGWRDYWADWVAGREIDRELPRPWLDGLDGERLDRVTHDAYLKFALRPAFLLRHLLACRSMAEVLRKTLAFFDMMLGKLRPMRRGAFRIHHENPAATFLRRWSVARQGRVPAGAAAGDADA